MAKIMKQAGFGLPGIPSLPMENIRKALRTKFSKPSRVFLFGCYTLLLSLFSLLLPVEAKDALSKPLPSADSPHIQVNVPTESEEVNLYGLVEAIHSSHKRVPDEGPSSLVGEAESEQVQLVTVRLSSPPQKLGLKSNVINVEHVLVENPAYRIPLKPGTRVLINAERKPGNHNWTFYITNRDRTPAILILGALSLIAVLLLGGPEVTKHVLLSLVVLSGCYKAFFPAIRSEETGPLWIFLMCAMYTILGTFIYQRPGAKAFSKEQSVVVLGTLGGLSILTGIMWIMHEITPLDGFTQESLAGLWYEWPKMDYWSFYLGSVILGFQGFIFYLCWSLAQNRGEEEPLGFWKRYNIVLLRGRRTLGPLLSSLSLLFIGLLMPILLQLDGTPTAEFVNLESTCSMLTFAMAGGLTLLLTVPLTALIAAWQLTPGGTSQTEKERYILEQ